jgi:hypothetical protein
VGDLATGETKKRSPKNISIARGFYDGPGGLTDPESSLEAHLSQIEAAAAAAIRRFVATPTLGGASPPAEVWRFLAWQAARTPGWIDVVQAAVDKWDPSSELKTVEPPPVGFDHIAERNRSYCVEDPRTGARNEAQNAIELVEFRKRGWRWVLRSTDQLEMIHVQAWYFQVRHFPRLSWVRLDSPPGDWFVTSDRGVTWLAGGLTNTPPAALRDSTAQVFAPLTRKTMLVGRNTVEKFSVTAREVNACIARTASTWIAGPTEEVVKLALTDRAASLMN